MVLNKTLFSWSLWPNILDSLAFVPRRSHQDSCKDSEVTGKYLLSLPWHLGQFSHGQGCEKNKADFNWASTLFCVHITSEQGRKLPSFCRCKCNSCDLVDTDTGLWYLWQSHKDPLRRISCCQLRASAPFLLYQEQKYVFAVTSKDYPSNHSCVLSYKDLSDLLLSCISRDDKPEPAPIHVFLICENTFILLLKKTQSDPFLFFLCWLGRPSRYELRATQQCSRRQAIGVCSLHSQFSAPYTVRLVCSLVVFAWMLPCFKTPPKAAVFQNIRAQGTFWFLNKSLGSGKKMCTK